MGGEPLGAEGIPWEGTLGAPHWEPFGCPKTNLEVFCDEVNFQEFPKSRKLNIRLSCETRSGGTGSQKVAHHFSAHFCLVKTPSIAIWGHILLRGGMGWGGRICQISFFNKVLCMSYCGALVNVAPLQRRDAVLLQRQIRNSKTS